jgi:K+-sensing histidine kinase KdpD
MQGEAVRNQVMFVKNEHVPGTFISVSAGPLRNDRGNVVGIVATFRDVTSFVERDEYRREMTNLLVHDLKGVMGVVIMNLSHVRRGVSPEDDDALADADEGARRAVRLVTNLLDVTRLEEGRLAPKLSRVDLPGLVRHAANLRRSIAREQSLDLDVVAPDKLKLPLDAELMSRVIENILDNAFRYAPSGGRVLLEVVETGGRVQLRMGNSGPAIPADAREVIFQKNVQLSHAAAHHTYGLGLYFSRMVIEAHRGTIRVESTKDLPTVFVVELPAPLSADLTQPG